MPKDCAKVHAGNSCNISVTQTPFEIDSKNTRQKSIPKIDPKSALQTCSLQKFANKLCQG